ncbi:MAG TPA: hypothetical protein VM120_23545 [Bryobacteraceae bacterium]|nr:hypothetical protein [Bryobacteraceae bacterium]
MEAHNIEAGEPELPSAREAIDGFWSSLGGEEWNRIELELVAKAPRFLRDRYLEGREERRTPL